MFNRIKTAIRIIKTDETPSGPDHVVIERNERVSSRPGKFIAQLIEIILAAFVFGFIAGRLGYHLSKILPAKPTASFTTIIGAVSVLLVFIVHWIKDDIEKKIRTHINLGEVLAPYFGRKLENTFRILRG